MHEIVLDAQNLNINKPSRSFQVKLFEKPPIKYQKKTEYNLNLVEQDMKNTRAGKTSSAQITYFKNSETSNIIKHVNNNAFSKSESM